MFLLLVICMNESFAQKRRFRTRRNADFALEYSLGASNLLGDLGGASKLGSHGIRDLDPQATKVAAGAGVTFFSTKPLSIRTNVGYAWLHGSDLYTQNEPRRVRNITVNTQTFLLNAMGELKVPLSDRGTFGTGPFLCLNAGVGAIYFNPHATYNGKSYSLPALSTEGQGLPGGPDTYNKIVLDIPFGASFKYYVSKYRSFGLELTAHKSFTDYLDDVSTNYYDNSGILNSRGDAAAYLADPNTTGAKRAAGSKRGNPNKNDNFFTLNFTYRYTLHSSRLF